jgi:hypothetical protein
MGHGIYHPHTSSTKVNEKVELLSYSPSGPSWIVLRVNFTLHFYCTKCIEQYTDKIIHTILHILILPSFLVENFLLPSCRSNFAKVDDITQKVEQACSRAM